MSARRHDAHDRPTHDDHDDHDDAAATHASSGYLTGFVLSVILTAIPFWLVMGKVFAEPGITAFVILAFAVVQIVVHMVYFLHMNTEGPKAAGRCWR